MKYRDRHSKSKLTARKKYRENDQYPTWSKTRVALSYSRRIYQLLSDDGEEIFWANNKKY